MSGNVWEWCVTQWQENYKDYLKKENNKPEGDVVRVLRGGAFYNEDRYVRCAYRYWYSPYYRYYYLGFRVVVCASSLISP
jgi:formylglycine-generating enzyme required for sulfatase activity